MDKEGKVIQKIEGKYSRRKFFKHISKYLLGLGAFTIASVFGLRRSGEFRLGRMKDIEFGLSEAHGECGASYDCSGGGGECGASYSCGGGGGGGGGGGECGASYDCSGGGGECGASYSCSGS